MPRPVSKGRAKFVEMVRRHHGAGPEALAAELDAAKIPLHLEGNSRDKELRNQRPDIVTSGTPWTLALKSKWKFPGESGPRSGPTLRSVVLSTFKHALPRERQPAEIKKHKSRDTAELLERFEARTQARGTTVDTSQLAREIVTEEKRQHEDEERERRQQSARRINALLNYDERAFIESLTPEERLRLERDRREGLKRLIESEQIPWWER
jgi:hypothetical protein